MCLSAEAYRKLTALVQGLAAETTGGRLVVAQEGGYSEIYGPYCTLAIVEQLVGERTGIEEPMPAERIAEWRASREVSADQSTALEAALAMQRRYWKV